MTNIFQGDNEEIFGEMSTIFHSTKYDTMKDCDDEEKKFYIGQIK